MKSRTASLLIAAFCAVVSPVIAGEFNSVIITPTSSPLTLDVPDEHFLRVRNFTQEGGGNQRGVVTVTANGQTENVLAAALIDQGPAPSPEGSTVPLESIKKVVIAGPAQVTVAPVAGATLFITYIRGAEPADATPTPTSTPTATPASTPTPTPSP